MGGTYKKPHRWTSGDTITAERENIYTDNDEYFKQKTDELQAGDETHRTAVPIDHPDGSISPVKIQSIDAPADGEVPAYNGWEERFEWMPFEEVTPPPPIDAVLELYKYPGVMSRWQHWLPEGRTSHATGGTGSFDWGSDKVAMHTGLTVGSYARVSKKMSPSRLVTPTWSDWRRLAIRLYVETSDISRIWLVTGALEDPLGYRNNLRHLGFLIQNKAIFSSVGDGSQSWKRKIYDLPYLSAYLSLELRYTMVYCYFYVNGKRAGVSTKFLPRGDIDADRAFDCSISNPVGQQMNMDVRGINFLLED